MQQQFMPIFSACPVISGNKSIFQTKTERVTLTAPGRLIKGLVQYCDGTRTLDDILGSLQYEWDPRSVKGLIKDLTKRGLLTDSRELSDATWSMAENPMVFPRNTSEEQVQKLVREARERHRSPSGCNFASTSSSLARLLADRRSVRSFSGDPISLQSIIDILWSAYGEIASEAGTGVRRTVPSAGALYPLVFHLTLFCAGEDMEPAVYRVLYDERGRVGLREVSGDTSSVSRAFLDPVSTLRGAAGVLTISGSFSITGEKYGNRSLLYVPLEAGHAAQNTLLAASEHGVASVEVGGFVDELLRDALQLPVEYRPLTSVVFGIEADTTHVISEGYETDWAVPMAGTYKPSFAIASARVSADRSWSHGRDPSPQLALTKAVAEAKEWASCGSVPELVHARFSELTSVVDPRDVIRFHPAQYRVKGFLFEPFDERMVYGWTQGYEIGSGSAVHVLADHVYFPYFPETPYYAFSNSSGCAAYLEEQTAIETATLELVERDAFMNAYLTRPERPSVAEETLPESIITRITALREEGFEVWLKDHSLDLAPVVCVFAQSESRSFTTCASCASFNTEYATSHALMEVEASVLARLQNDVSVSIKPSEVEMPLDHGLLYKQKRYFRRADFLALCGGTIAFQDLGANAVRSWSALLEQFRQKGWRPLVIPLQLSDTYGGNGDLHIVRVIVPGMVPMTFGYRQEPAGMARVYDVAERFGGDNLTYKELTKFPHPFE